MILWKSYGLPLLDNSRKVVFFFLIMSLRSLQSTLLSGLRLRLESNMRSRRTGLLAKRGRCRRFHLFIISSHYHVSVIRNSKSNASYASTYWQEIIQWLREKTSAILIKWWWLWRWWSWWRCDDKDEDDGNVDNGRDDINDGNEDLMMTMVMMLMVIMTDDGDDDDELLYWNIFST